jgi:hypothetical protein
MPEGFWDRVSGLMAWLGLVSLWFLPEVINEPFAVGLAWWIGIGAFNYLLVGSWRLVPWWYKDK